jgi:outer membrane protein assembly factor BamA
MLHPRPAILAVAAQALLLVGSSGPIAWAQEGVVRKLVRIEFQGGSEDDHRFSEAALGFRPGMSIDEGQLAQGLSAVRMTDRFRDVRGRLEGSPSGVVVRIELVPIPALKGWTVAGSLPVPVKKDLLPGLRKGMRIGNLRLEQFRLNAEVRLREAGYPRAKVVARREGPARIRFELDPGTPDLIQGFRFEGNSGVYGTAKLLKLLKAEPRRTLWTQEFRREALARIRQRFMKDKRFQGQAELSFREDGVLLLKADPGPVVRLASEGKGLGFKSLKDLVPLARSDRYSPELLEAGARSIIRYLRAKGYLDAEVTHRTEVVKGTPENPEEIRVIYVLVPGERLDAARVRFERNQEIPSEELEKVADLPSTWMGLFPTPWTTDLIGAVEERIKGHYRSQGYADFNLRKLPLEREDGKGTLVIQVKEGNRRFLEALTLEVPADPSFKAWYLAESLTFSFADRPMLIALDSERVRRFQSDRPGMKGLQGTLQELEATDNPGVRRFRFRFNRPLPLLKNDLAQAVSALRQRVASLGALQPQQKLRLEPGAEGTIACFEVPSQPLATVRRLVVQGSDATRARAVLRETRLDPGAPMDPDRLSKAQAQLGSLGSFEQMDLLPLSEAEGTTAMPPWQDGDLLLKVGERSPWVFSSGFGYDKSQGYHLDLGAQRLNLGGMGRTLDFGIRAGDASFRNSTLRKWFPTGEYTRSVDSYRVGYTDPWFAPGFLEHWLPDRTQLVAEGAYLEERRSVYLLRRRRFLSGFEWDLSGGLLLQTGYRFERSEVNPLPGSGILDSDLEKISRMKGRAIISGPYVQAVRDRRDNRLDPTSGSFSVARFEFANQVFGTSSNSSFVKLDIRQQWNWALGYKAARGVVSLGLRAGVAKPTAASAEDLPLSERFFGGGPGTHRGVEPDFLGATAVVHSNGTNSPLTQTIPLGGQGLLLANLEYRFPTWWPTVWGEVFVDSGQVYSRLNPPTRLDGDPAPFPAFRTALGVGLILKIGMPIKLEYAADLKRIFGRTRTEQERETQLKSLLVSAGFQF